MPDWGEGGGDNVCLHSDSKQKECLKEREGGTGTCKELSWFSGLSHRKVDIYQIRRGVVLLGGWGQK